MSDEPQLSFLEWDSDFFGCRIARVESRAFGERSAQGILRQARSESIECLYLLVDAAKSESVRAAERAGFSLVDVGYITCKIPQADLGVLGRVARSDEKRGMGYGARLFNGALGWLAGQGCSRVRAVTQARNIAATRVYKTNVFRTVSVEHSYHRWLDGRGVQ